MSKEAENIALFDRYLRDEMSADERVSFEKQLSEDKVLKADFEAFRMLEKAIENQEIIEFKEQLKNWDAVPAEKKVVLFLSLKLQLLQRLPFLSE